MLTKWDTIFRLFWVLELFWGMIFLSSYGLQIGNVENRFEAFVPTITPLVVPVHAAEKAVIPNTGFAAPARGLPASPTAAITENLHPSLSLTLLTATPEPKLYSIQAGSPK